MSDIQKSSAINCGQGSIFVFLSAMTEEVKVLRINDFWSPLLSETSIFCSSSTLLLPKAQGTLVRKWKEKRMRRIRGKWGRDSIELWLLRVARLLYSWPRNWCGDTHKVCTIPCCGTGKAELCFSLRMCRQLIIDGGKTFSLWMLLWAVLMKLIMSPKVRKKAQKKKRGKLGRGRERVSEGGEVVCVWIRNSLWNITQSITVYT